jgi:hypothetical protein
MKGLLLTLLLAVAATMAAGIPVPSSCDGAPNPYPVTAPTPQFVSKAMGGARYSLPGTNISIVHLHGTAYEMGQQYGTLMRTEIQELFADFYEVRRGC